MFEIAKSAIFRGVEAVKPEKLVAEFLAVDPSGSQSFLCFLFL